MSVLQLSIAALLLGLSAVAHADIDLLRKMNQAVHHLNYEGEFVHQFDDRLNAMRIRHEVQGEYEREYLTTLTGAKREILRDNSALMHLQSALKQKKDQNRYRPTLITVDPERLQANYHIQHLGKDRVAGFQAQVLLLKPKDTHRYLQQIYIDQKTQLPLRRVVLDQEGSQLSQTMFSRLEVITNPKKLSLPQGGPDQVQPVSSNWMVENLPAGFQFQSYNQESGSEHFQFTDGLVRVSLYIEQADKKSEPRHSSIGPVGIVVETRGDREFIVVGEAPLDTLKLFINNVVAK